MVDTPQTLEIATRLWMEADPLQTAPHFGTQLMHFLLLGLEDISLDILQCVQESAGDNPSLVAELVINNTRNALVAPQFNLGDDFSMHIGLMTRLSLLPEHPFLDALLSKGVIPLVTSALVKLGKIVNSRNARSLAGSINACFCYLHNFLEFTDGFTWVTQAIRARLFQAFCDCNVVFCIFT